ncbi:hypothetical protein T06_12560 [Trichinella sp. T6]|nr:hypothetical protein T06_12560 [Trichinella sp. T6]
MSRSILQNRRTPADTSSHLDCVGRRHDGAGTKIPVQLPSQRSQSPHGDLAVVWQLHCPCSPQKSAHISFSIKCDRLNEPSLDVLFLIVSASCITPIESISQNLLNSKLSSSVALAELLSVTVETMVVSCLPAELRAFAPQRTSPKMVSMAIGSSSPAILSTLPSTR